MAKERYNPLPVDEYIKQEQDRILREQENKRRTYGKSNKEFLESLSHELKDTIEDNDKLEFLLTEAQKKGKTEIQIKKEIADFRQKQLNEDINALKKNEEFTKKIIGKLQSPLLSNIESIINFFGKAKKIRKLEELTKQQSNLSNILGQKHSFDIELAKEEKERKKEENRKPVLPQSIPVVNPEVQQPTQQPVEVVNPEVQQPTQQPVEVGTQVGQLDNNEIDRLLNELKNQENQQESPTKSQEVKRRSYNVLLSPLEEIETITRETLKITQESINIQEGIKTNIESLISMITNIGEDVNPIETEEANQKQDTDKTNKSLMGIEKETKKANNPQDIKKNVLTRKKAEVVFDKTINATNVKQQIKIEEKSIVKEMVTDAPAIAKAEEKNMVESISDKKQEGEELLNQLETFLKDVLAPEIAKQISNKNKNRAETITGTSPASSSHNAAGH